MKSIIMLYRGMKSLFSIIFVVALFQSCDTEKKQEVSSISEEDKNAIETLARDVPMILSNQGWDAYEATFAQDYINWSMVGDKVRGREEYLGLVKDWYDQGNRATGSTIKSIDFIPVTNDMVLYLYALQERFNDPLDSSKTRIRDIRFVATYTKKDGVWKNAFTAFMDKPNTE